MFKKRSIFKQSELALSDYTSEVVMLRHVPDCGTLGLLDVGETKLAKRTETAEVSPLGETSNNPKQLEEVPGC